MIDFAGFIRQRVLIPPVSAWCEEHGRLVDLEVTHRLRARSEDGIRGAEYTGFEYLPLHSLAESELSGSQ